MRNSFQEQMLKLGLVDKKKAAEVKNEKHKAKKRSNKAGKGALSITEENALLAQKAAEKKKARDRQLNREREAKLQKRAETAQVKQLIEQYRVKKDDSGHPYRFNVSGKIFRVFVDAETAEKLSRGSLGIVEMVGSAGQFEIVPEKVITRIREIDARVFTSLAEAPATGTGEATEDDPYAEYTIPDDLMW